MDHALNQATQSSGELTRHEFSFTGNSWEYFGICIRTFLLSVLTLGIYSAWGTVERRRYMLGHTRVSGHGFDYHAKPTTILKGRLIAIAIAIALVVLSLIMPMSGLILPIAILLGIPWIIVRSLRFNAINTSYRNIRFHFDGTYRQSFMAYIFAPIVAMLSLLLLYPYLLRRAAHFMLNGYRFGTSRFSGQIPFRALFVPWLGCLVLVLAAAIALVALMLAADTLPARVLGALVTVAIVPFIAMFTFGAYRVHWRNRMVGAAHLEGGHRIESTLGPCRSAAIILAITLPAALSLGLLMPWAMVRLRRYFMQHTALLANGELDNIIAHQKQAGGAAVAEYGEMEGISDGIMDGII